MAADDGLPQLRFASAAEWEQWLESNHDSAQGVWLKLAKKGSGIASVTRAETLDACLCFGWIDGRREALDDDYYLQRYTPRRRPNPRRRGADAIAAYRECRLTCLYGKRGDARRRALGALYGWVHADPVAAALL